MEPRGGFLRLLKIAMTAYQRSSRDCRHSREEQTTRIKLKVCFLEKQVMRTGINSHPSGMKVSQLISHPKLESRRLKSKSIRTRSLGDRHLKIIYLKINLGLLRNSERKNLLYNIRYHNSPWMRKTTNLSRFHRNKKILAQNNLL